MPFSITRTLAEHQLEKVNTIDVLRVTKNNAPILFQTILWDADPTARENINGKIVEISSKIALGITTAELFWKDSANTIHAWATLESYLIWLRGLAIAIAERNTNLYAICWTKKSQIQTLATLTEVLSYDINIGW